MPATSSSTPDRITLGGHLVTINDQAENDFVFNTFAALHPNDDLWIGFNDVAVEGTFEWVSGEPITFTNWQPEPNDLFGEDYGVIWRENNFNAGFWNDLDNAAARVPNSTPYGVVEIVLAAECGDGIDNDGDGLTDFPDDPGCASVSSDIENPECDDGIDNDGDGFIDFIDFVEQANLVNGAWVNI